MELTKNLWKIDKHTCRACSFWWRLPWSPHFCFANRCRTISALLLGLHRNRQYPSPTKQSISAFRSFYLKVCICVPGAALLHLLRCLSSLWSVPWISRCIAPWYLPVQHILVVLSIAGQLLALEPLINVLRRGGVQPLFVKMDFRGEKRLFVETSIGM